MVAEKNVTAEVKYNKIDSWWQ